MLNKTKFDPAREFVVARPFLAHGKQQATNTPFDKSKVDARRLRQLFDQRFIAMAAEDTSPAAYLSGLSDDQIHDWLVTRGVTPRRGNRERLLKQAERILADDATALPTLPKVA